jgi:hypothetical protein
MWFYAWAISQPSSAYFQAYRLVYERARRAERAFVLELGVKQPGFIVFYYWNNIRKGLSASQRLRLRQHGSCFFSVSEALFDLDYPDH